MHLGDFEILETGDRTFEFIHEGDYPGINPDKPQEELPINYFGRIPYDMSLSDQEITDRFLGSLEYGHGGIHRKDQSDEAILFKGASDLTVILTRYWEYKVWDLLKPTPPKTNDGSTFDQFRYASNEISQSLAIALPRDPNEDWGYRREISKFVSWHFAEDRQAVLNRFAGMYDSEMQRAKSEVDKIILEAETNKELQYWITFTSRLNEQIAKTMGITAKNYEIPHRGQIKRPKTLKISNGNGKTPSSFAEQLRCFLQTNATKKQSKKITETMGKVVQQSVLDSLIRPDISAPRNYTLISE